MYRPPRVAHKVAIQSGANDRLRCVARGCVPIFLPPDEAEAYYNGFCNDVLWPLFHYVVSRTPEMDDAAERDEELWLAYRRVNERFANVVAGIAR